MKLTDNQKKCLDNVVEWGGQCDGTFNHVNCIMALDPNLLFQCECPVYREMGRKCCYASTSPLAKAQCASAILLDHSIEETIEDA